MSKKVKWLITFAGLMFAALVVWVVKTTPDAPPPVEKSTLPLQMEYEGNELSEEVNGVKIWDLTAERMIVDANTQNAELEKLIGHFYQADGRSIEFRAEHGAYNYETKDIYVNGNIFVETSDGARLICDQLGWVNKDGMLIALDNVKIIRDDIKATGDRAESADGFKHFWLKGHAHITKGMQPEEETDAQSEQPTLEPKETKKDGTPD